MVRGRAGWRGFRQHAGAIAGSVAIVALFLLPVLLELALHKPNNLDYVRAYLRNYPNPNRGLGVAIQYFLGFLTFSRDGAPGAAPVHVAVYWIIFGAGACACIALTVRHRELFSRFTRIVAIEIAVIVALFLYWANRITGDMYQFNGYFICSLHILALFLIAGTLSAGQAHRRPDAARWARFVWLVPFAGMVAAAGDFRNPDMGVRNHPHHRRRVALPGHLRVPLAARRLGHRRGRGQSTRAARAGVLRDRRLGLHVRL
jgi:hypothetical protein